ncbi:hypothetical protein [Parvularcula lutaonensis]|uniref:Lipoprotein n=1 Tax=Parvularcula lutaonensis TaxID=491923 RepID=A0ABV7MAS0_9PROT|nr:hypothetical protein [Parvularcula lutaonensis]GGY36813.1 hypothetical protein GCM10007148_01240 [Parvularcula lutaonensis]
MRAELMATALWTLLAACGGEATGDRAYLDSEGLWGWQNGAGCEGLKDAVEVDGKRIVFFEDGRRVGRAKLVERTYDTDDDGSGMGTGRVMFATWTFIAPDPRAPSDLVRHAMRFEVERDGDRITRLRAVDTRRLIDRAKTQRIIDESRAGDGLAHCDTGVPRATD